MEHYCVLQDCIWMILLHLAILFIHSSDDSNNCLRSETSLQLSRIIRGFFSKYAIRCGLSVIKHWKNVLYKIK